MANTKRKHKVQKLLRVGDVVYSAMNGKEMTVLSMGDMGFETEEDFFLYDEVTELYFLTKRCAMERGKKT